jgi:hypothetical protein
MEWKDRPSSSLALTWPGRRKMFGCWLQNAFSFIIPPLSEQPQVDEWNEVAG